MSSKLREALEDSQRLLENFAWGGNGAQVREQMRDNKSALAEPVRNCEVGTPEELNIRHDKYCFKHSEKCGGIITSDCIACFAKWAQMPYEPVETKN